MTFEDELRAYRIAILVQMQKAAVEEAETIGAAVSMLSDRIAGVEPTQEEIEKVLSNTELQLCRKALLRLVVDALATLQTGRVL